MGTPALLAAQSAKILSAANQSSGFLYRRADVFGLAADGSTSAAASASVVTASVSHAAGILVFPSGTAYQIVAVADKVFSDAADKMTLSYGVTNYAAAAHVFDASSGSVAGAIVWSSASSTDDVAAPTDDEITAALGTTEWVRLANALYPLGSASAVTSQFDNAPRSGYGNVAAGFNADLATSESGWNSSLSS